MYWLGGTYAFPYPSSDDCHAKVTVTFNWLEPQKSMHWTVDTLTVDAAYPGKHRGSLIHREDDPRKIELEWDTPIFSPYVRLQRKKSEPILSLALAVVKCPDYSNKTTIFCGKKKIEVMVLQNVMKAVCNILVHGPKEQGIPTHRKSPVELKFKYSSYDGDINDLIYTFFQRETRLR